MSIPSTRCYESGHEAPSIQTRSQKQSFQSRNISKLVIESTITNANTQVFTVSMQEKSWESFWFTKLSNEIFDQFVSEVDHNNSIATRVAGSDTRANRDERMKTLTENMKTTTTHYCYGDYPWNTVSRYSRIYACPVGNRYYYLSKSFYSFLLCTYKIFL